MTHTNHSVLLRFLDAKAGTFVLVMLAVSILVPVLNLAVPESSAFHICKPQASAGDR